MLRILAVILFVVWCLSSASTDAQSIHPRFSPDGETVVFYTRIGDQARIELWRPHSGIRRSVLDQSGYYANPGYIGDTGELVLAGSTNDMRDVWDVFTLSEDGNLTALTNTPEREMHASASPNGEHIVYVRFVGAATQLVELDLGTRQERVVYGGTGRVFHPKYSSDGSSIFFDLTIDNLTGIYQLNRDTLDVSELFLPDDTMDYAVSPAQSPVAQQIAFSIGGDINEIVLLDMQSGELTSLVQNEGDIGAPHWSPDGRALVFHQESDGEFDIVFLELASGRLIRMNHAE